jgi:hypothetical protein
LGRTETVPGLNVMPVIVVVAVLALAHSAICAIDWLVNEFDITNDGWPVAQPRFTRRPRASSVMRLPLGKMN